MRGRGRAASLVAAGILLLTAAAFAPVARNGFILYDDHGYITENPHVTGGLTAAGLRWALTATESSNWHPLTWAVHMLDVELFGLNPAGHHLSSAAWHAATAVLLFLVLAAMTGRRWPSALAAALFAVHPLRVESVAWASEKKDVVSGLLAVLALGAHLRYVRRPGAGRYAALALCLALGLAAKPMLVTVPLLLLLLDWWPLGRTAPGLRGGPPGRRTPAFLLAEKLPLLALAAAAAAATWLAQRGAVKDFEEIPLVPRLLNALLSCAQYLIKTAWPAGLSPFYPHPGPDLSIGAALAAAAALLLATLAARRAWRRRPWLAAGWCWYLVTLLPVIGIVQAGWQGMADRYTYLPHVGIFIALAWEVAALAPTPGRRRAVGAVALAALGALALLSARQATLWRDSVSVFTRAAEISPGTFYPEHYLEMAYRVADNPAEAARHGREAVRINPRYHEAWSALGADLSALGDVEGAARAWEQSLQLYPQSAPDHNNLGFALARLGRLEEALAQYEAALRINPDYALAHANAGVALGLLGRGAEAAEHLRRADEAAARRAP